MVDLWAGKGSPNVDQSVWPHETLVVGPVDALDPALALDRTPPMQAAPVVEDEKFPGFKNDIHRLALRDAAKFGDCLLSRGIRPAGCVAPAKFVPAVDFLHYRRLVGVH